MVSQDFTEAAAVAANRKRKMTKKRSKTKRIIPSPKIGGILPLIPIFAALGALGSLAGGAAAIAKTVGDKKDAKAKQRELERHNKVMEDMAMGKGLFLKPYTQKLGNGLKTIKKKKRQTPHH